MRSSLWFDVAHEAYIDFFHICGNSKDIIKLIIYVSLSSNILLYFVTELNLLLRMLEIVQHMLLFRQQAFLEIQLLTNFHNRFRTLFSAHMFLLIYVLLGCLVSLAAL